MCDVTPYPAVSWRKSNHSRPYQRWYFGCPVQNGKPTCLCGLLGRDPFERKRVINVFSVENARATRWAAARNSSKRYNFIVDIGLVPSTSSCLFLSILNAGEKRLPFRIWPVHQSLWTAETFTIQGDKRQQHKIVQKHTHTHTSTHPFKREGNYRSRYKNRVPREQKHDKAAR